MADLSIPFVGLGTWIPPNQEPSTITNITDQAIKMGYRHFDTAANYGTELLVEKAILDSGFPRDAFFVTTKYGSGRVPTPSEMYRYHLIGGCVDDCGFDVPSGTMVSGYTPAPLAAENVGFPYFDAILLHHPPLVADRDRFEREVYADYRKLYNLQQAGYTKHIGVSNFYPRQLGLLLEVCDLYNFPYPKINQLELHLIDQQWDHAKACQDLGIEVVAHTPLGGLAANQLLEIEPLSQIAQRLQATPSQVALAYTMRRGIPVLPRSSSSQHLEENLAAVHLINQLTNDDIQLLQSVDQNIPMVELSATSYELDSRLGLG